MDNYCQGDNSMITLDPETRTSAFINQKNWQFVEESVCAYQVQVANMNHTWFRYYIEIQY